MTARRLAATALLATAGVAGLLAAPATAADDEPTADDGGPAYTTIVSMPDFLNTDVGDVSRLRRWNGVHNSINPSYQASLDVVLDQVVDERPDSVLVAGDLVEGHWGIDADRTGTFGRVDSSKSRLKAVARAGRLYFGFWKQLFTSRGLPLPHVAVGDHEIGDNNWRAGAFKHRAVPVFKDTFADALIGSRYAPGQRPVGTPYERTSYWTELHPEVMLVSVDVFRRTRRTSGSNGGVVPDLSGGHLAWFRRVLAHGAATHDWVIVQAHTPVLGPVRVTGSSGLFLRGGADSAMWQSMRDYGVDAYLAGEVHDVTAIDPLAGPVQISHGGLFASGRTNYLRMEVTPDRIRLSTHRFGASVDGGARLWQTSNKRPPSHVVYRREVTRTGQAQLTSDGRLLGRTGELAPAGLSPWDSVAPSAP